MGALAIRGLRKTYDNGVTAVHDVSLQVADGEFMVLVGPSGCGKSSTLRMVAGLEEASAGSIHIGGREVTDLPPAARGVAMVFQSYALYPHMTVAENLGFALKLAGADTAERRRRVAAAAEVLQLEPLLQRLPRQLSGGQRQRVAIGRAIVREPAVFLFDEPLSNLDAALRTQMRVELARLHQRLGSTIVYVTHDQVEAMTLGQRIAVFDAGRIEQVGTPLTLYRRPANRFVAGFLGSPRMNFLPAALLADPALGLAPGTGAASIGVRPEHLQRLPADAGHGLPADIELAEALGDCTLLHCRVAGLDETVVVKAAGDAEASSGPCRLWAEPQHLLRFDAEGLALAA